jgi:hypothetical protein
MLLQQFSERAVECIRFAERAKSDHDRDFFTELARAWCGVNVELPKNNTRSRYRSATTPGGLNGSQVFA